MRHNPSLARTNCCIVSRALEAGAGAMNVMGSLSKSEMPWLPPGWQIAIVHQDVFAIGGNRLASATGKAAP